jgi:hypothetical protein
MNRAATLLSFLRQDLPVFLAQERLNLEDLRLRPRTIDPTYVLIFLGGVALIVFILVLLTYYYQNRRRYLVLEDEVKSLDLDNESEMTLVGMVKRFTRNEPITILSSERLFDEMASREILRVLSSPASSRDKQRFIDVVYKIRKRTYHSKFGKETGEEVHQPEPPQPSRRLPQDVM